MVIVRNCLAPMRYFEHDTPRHVRQDSVGMNNEERMAYSAAHSTSMFFRQNTYIENVFLLHIFKHSKMDGNSFGTFNQNEMFAGSSRDLLTFLTYLCYLLASCYLEVPVRSSRQRKEESSFVAAHGTQQTRGRTDWSMVSPSKLDLFLPPKQIDI